jgi:ABC-type multidrug transport system fused ATPase/permease subunit
VRRRSLAAQDTLAEASAFAGETIGAARTVQAFNAEGIATERYGAAVEQAYEAARAAIKSRALLTGVAITLVFGSIVAVLWFGAQSVLAGTLSAGTLGQFLLYSLIAAGSMGTLSEVWASFPRHPARRSGWANCCRKFLRSPPLQIRCHCPSRHSAASASPTCTSPIPRAFPGPPSRA